MINPSYLHEHSRASAGGPLLYKMKTWLIVAAVVSLNAGAVEVTPRDSVVVDVVVVGAGSAGVPAAIQSGRLGAKTVLVESGPLLGGNLTLGGVEHPIPFRKNGNTVIAGIGLEWTLKSIALGHGAEIERRTGKPFEPEHAALKEGYDPWTFLCVGEEMLREAGVDLRYYETPVKVEKLAPPNVCNWRVVTGAQGGVREILCRQLVDATGNGCLAEMCGATFLPMDSENQPGSFHYGITGMPSWKQISRELVEKKYAEAMEKGLLQEGDTHGDKFGPLQILRWPASNYMYGADNTTSESRTRTNMRGRASALRILRFIRSLPGGEAARISWMSAEVGVRETRCVKGLVVMNIHDFTAGRVWDDSISYATWFIDFHVRKWQGYALPPGVRPIGPDVYPTIPFRALVPAGVDNLLVAGRCLSADRLTMSSVRVCAPAMATGQAAGCAAALAAKAGKTPAALDMAVLKKTLAAHGQVIPSKGLFSSVNKGI